MGELSQELEKSKPDKGHGAGLPSGGKTKASVLAEAGISTSQAHRAETKHGEWLPALMGVGITPDTAQRLMLLRQTYAEIPQLAVFDSVSAALNAPRLTRGKSPRTGGSQLGEM